MEKFDRGCGCGWEKYSGNPVLGGALGTCFDLSMLREAGGYRMYFSWRPKKSVAVSLSKDGLCWSEPRIVLSPRTTAEGWEDDVNRPSVVLRGGVYHMWYTGQLRPGREDGMSHIFYAVSGDGLSFRRVEDGPVLSPSAPWEKRAVMNPDVLWDEPAGLYRMWYSAGGQNEPDAIGCAVSEDGLHWRKNGENPVFAADPSHVWEHHKAAGCHVVREAGGYLMFYIGYHDEGYAQIGLARSFDGAGPWERHPGNPILAPDEGAWDAEACYKPFALYDGEKWILWYNGRRGSVEQIGAAFHKGRDLGFPPGEKV